MTRRTRGITLVEMVWAMTATVALLAMMGWGTARLVRFGSDTREHAQSAIALERLAAQFRRDVHTAQSVRIAPDDPRSLQLFVAPDDPIVYRLTEQGVERHNAAKFTVGPPRETYRLPGYVPARWTVDDERPLVTMELGREPELGQPEDPGLRRTVVAAWHAEPTAAPPGGTP